MSGRSPTGSSCDSRVGSPVESPILRPGETVWRLAHADRAALLVDAANYYGALRCAFSQACHSIVIVGWDIDSRTPLVGADGAGDDAPETLLPYLEYLVERRPGLDIRLLLWDYSVLYALEREPLPSLNLKWRTPEQIDVALDSCLPLGACHHQKLVVVDGTLAFCGGLDLTVRRWDTTGHRLDEPRRVHPDGRPYPPFHDVQMAVDGDAARALFDIVQRRWEAAGGKAFPVPDASPLWPEGVAPDFSDVAVGIARTEPHEATAEVVQEVRDLYLASIQAATRHIYIENQYLTADVLAEALAGRLSRVPELEVVAVTPRLPDGWLEARTMGAAQEVFMEKMSRGEFAERVRFLHPWVGGVGEVGGAGGDEKQPVMVHAKLMIVDDRLLRVGSSNLNRRSMGVDSECDLAIEAAGEEDKRIIRRLLCRQLGEHLGVESAAAEAALTESGSIIRVVDALGGEHRGLAPVADREQLRSALSDAMNLAADPERPIRPEEFLGDMFGARMKPRQLAHLLRLSVVAAVLLGLVFAWNFTPLAHWADPETLADSLNAVRNEWWIYPVMLAGYLFFGLLLFPLMALVAVTGLVLGPVNGFLVAMTGALISGWVGFRIGAWTGGHLFERLSRRAYRVVSRTLRSHGLLAVAALRMVPIGPYTAVNIAMGATGIGSGAFLGGTFVGLLPGILVLTMLGDRLREAWRDPEPANLALFILFAVLWLALAWVLQRLVTALRGRGKLTIR